MRQFLNEQNLDFVSMATLKTVTLQWVPNGAGNCVPQTAQMNGWRIALKVRFHYCHRRGWWISAKLMPTEVKNFFSEGLSAHAFRWIFNRTRKWPPTQLRYGESHCPRVNASWDSWVGADTCAKPALAQRWNSQGTSNRSRTSLQAIKWQPQNQSISFILTPDRGYTYHNYRLFAACQAKLSFFPVWLRY